MKGNRHVLTHVGLAAAGFAVVLLATRRPVEEIKSQPRPAGPSERISASPARSPTSRTRPPATSKARGFHDAWERIASRRLSREARFELQIELLKRWGEVDLEGAVKAALAEAWDEDLDSLLRSAFGQIFADKPEDVWRLIQNQHFGTLETAVVRNAWVSAISKRDPHLLLAYLPEMKGVLFRNTLNSLVTGLQSREQANQLWDELATRGAWSGDAQAHLGTVGKRFADLLSAEELREKLAGSKGPLAGLACSALATKLTHEGGVSDIRAEIDKIPENLRSQLASEFLLPANRNKSAVAGAFEHLVENEEWEVLSRRAALEQVRWLGTVSDPLALADWAANLPPRKETALIFDQGMGPFIIQNPVAAWEWISGFEQGMWKDRARGFYAINYLKAGDTARSQEVLHEIQDPMIRKDADRWLSNWKAEQVGKAK